MCRKNPRHTRIGWIRAVIVISADSGCTTSKNVEVPAATPESGSFTYDLVTEYQQSLPKYILHEAEYEKYGFQGMVKKPFQPADLRRVLREVIHNKNRL